MWVRNGEDQAIFSKRPCASMRLRLSIGQLGFGSLSKTHGLLHETGLAPEHAPDPSEHEASILAEKTTCVSFHCSIFQYISMVSPSCIIFLIPAEFSTCYTCFDVCLGMVRSSTVCCITEAIG